MVDRIRPDTDREGSAAPPGEVSARAGWYMVSLLALLYTLSFVDRYILSVVADPMARSLSLSDSQLGLLLGAGFAIIYALIGLPMAQWVDSRGRIKLLVAGVILWSTMTIFSAFAQNFTMLLIARAGVAVGEAVLSPAAISLIADYFVKEKRALPTTAYTSVAGFMGTGAFVICGAAYSIGLWLYPTLGMEPWRVALLVVGAPGIFVAILFGLTVKEPPRRQSGHGVVDDASVGVFLRYLARHWQFYLPFYLSGAFMTLFSLSLLIWMPTLLQRAHGFSAQEAGYVFGLIATPTTLLATIFWPLLAKRFEKKAPNTGVPIGLLLASLWGIAFFIFSAIMGSATLFLIGVTLSIITSTAWAVLPPLGFQYFGPPRMRGRLSALSLLGMNLIGFGLGPSLAVMIGGMWANAGIPEIANLTSLPLAWGLATIGAFVAPIMILCTAICVRTVKRLPVLEG